MAYLRVISSGSTWRSYVATSVRRLRKSQVIPRYTMFQSSVWSSKHTPADSSLACTTALAKLNGPTYAHWPHPYGTSHRDRRVPNTIISCQTKSNST
eukprot:6210955-Pleurochrysis_carterae.AAC.3